MNPVHLTRQRKASQYTTSCCWLAQLASSKQQFITNHRGDVLSIRDSEDKEVANYTYDAYGNELSAAGDLAKANPIRYAGYYYDEETKNYYLQARYYNPANGAFLALDPHPGDDDEPLSQNGYIYTSGNPVMNVDPNGNNPYLLAAIVRFAAPLIKSLGKKASKKIVDYAKKLLKPIKRYKVTSSNNAIIVVIDTKSKLKNKRIFSIDHHKNIPIYHKKNKKNIKNTIEIWHYHSGPMLGYGRGGNVHRVFKWDIPKNHKLKVGINYVYA